VFLTTRQISKIMGVSERTVQRWCAERDLPYQTVRRRGCGASHERVVCSEHLVHWSARLGDGYTPADARRRVEDYVAGVGK